MEPAYHCDWQLRVQEFHRATLIPVGTVPNPLTLDRLKLRLGLFDEFIELLEASGMAEWRVRSIKQELLQGIDSIQDGNPQDVVEMADALGDIVVVAFGMAIEMGIDLNRVLDEIMRANMSKLNEDGTPLVNVCRHWIADPDGDTGEETRAYCQHQLKGEEICKTPDHWVKPDDPHGKVLKASGYKPPDINRVLISQDPLP